MRLVDQRIALEHQAHRIRDRLVIVRLGGLDREPVDNVAVARDPPGEPAGEALRLQAQDAAGERDRALFDRELDEAPGSGGAPRTVSTRSPVPCRTSYSCSAGS
jgi:hypothetical protein